MLLWMGWGTWSLTSFFKYRILWLVFPKEEPDTIIQMQVMYVSEDIQKL
jgi:hypothetical protein